MANYERTVGQVVILHKYSVADEPEAIPTVELTGTREALTWLTGRILAIASSADESYEYLDEVDLRALSISSKRVC